MDNYLSTFAAGDFATDFRKLIDVSTDGGENKGTDPAGKTSTAVNNLGYQAVNCLGIGTNLASLCGWNNGFGDDYGANTFAEVETALRTKIQAEICPPGDPNCGAVPVPATVWLMGLGLLGLRRFANRG